MKKLSMVIFCLVVMCMVASVTLSQAQEHDDHECEPEMTCGDQMATPKPKQPGDTGPRSKQVGSKTSINKNKDGKGDNTKGKMEELPSRPKTDGAL